MTNNIDTVNNKSKVNQTPVWDLVSEICEVRAHIINRFVTSLGLSFISAGNTLYFSLATMGKLIIVIFTWEFKDLAKTALKALFCFMEAIYTPFVFSFAPGKVIGWHEKVFGERDTQKRRELFRRELVEKCEGLEKKLREEAEERKKDLEKMETEIKCLKETIATYENKQAIPNVQTINSELELCQNKLNQKTNAYNDLDKAHENLKQKLAPLNEQLKKLEAQKLENEKQRLNVGLNDNQTSANQKEKIELELQINNLKSEILKLNTDIESKQNALELMEKENKDLKNKIENLELEKKNLNNEKEVACNTLKNDLAKMESKYNVSKDQSSKKDTELNTLRNKLKELEQLREEQILLDNMSKSEVKKNEIENKKEVIYSELHLQLIENEKTTEKMFEDYFKQENQQNIIDNEENSNGFMKSILVSKAGVEDSDAKEIKQDLQKKHINNAIKAKKETEKDRSTFDQVPDEEIKQQIETSVKQLSQNCGKATFTTDPLSGKKTNYSVVYKPKQITGGKDINLSILDNSTKLDQFDLFYEGHRFECGQNNENAEGEEVLKNNAHEFAETLEYIIMEVIQKDAKQNEQIKKNLIKNFDVIVNAVYQHITSGSGTNINKLNSRLFAGHMKENPLGLSIALAVDKPLRTDLSIDKEGNICIEQIAYTQLMLPVLSEKVGTGLYSKSIVTTKISSANPQKVVMEGSYTDYLSQQIHEIEENKKLESQDSYWQAFKATFINTNTSYKDEKYIRSLKVIEMGFEEQFKKGIGLDEKLFRKELKIDEKESITLKTLQEAYNSKNKLDALNESVRDILNLLVSEEKIEIRNKYQKFLSLLRQALETETYKSNIQRKKESLTYDPAVDLLLNMAYYRLAENNLYDYCHNLVDLHIIKGINPNATLENNTLDLSKLSLKEQMEAIDAAPKEMKGTAGVAFGKIASLLYDFDPHRKTNVPFTWGKIFLGGKFLRWLRMGSPTNQDFFSTNNNPEFIAFLDMLQFMGKKLVFGNLQNEEPRWIEDESVRVNKMRELTKTHPGVFEVFSLPYNSDLHYQNGEYSADVVSYKTLKGWIITAIKNNKQGYYFPDEVRKNNEFLNYVDEILDDVHQIAFNGAETLDKEKRKVFMSMHKAFLGLFYSIWRGSDFLLYACKDAKDRAGQLMGLIFELIAALNGELGKETVQEKVRAFYNAAALMVSKEPIIEKSGRRETAIKGSEQINSVTVSKNIKEFDSGRLKKYGVTKDSVLQA